MKADEIESLREYVLKMTELPQNSSIRGEISINRSYDSFIEDISDLRLKSLMGQSDKSRDEIDKLVKLQQKQSNSNDDVSDFGTADLKFQ